MADTFNTRLRKGTGYRSRNFSIIAHLAATSSQSTLPIFLICLSPSSPPYYGNETDYGKNTFYRDDFEKLRDVLAVIQGKCIMSINNVDYIRQLYSEFTIEEVETTCNMSHKKEVVELFIRNY
ncbi:DNA adenine methylase [Candidatus Magnetominusculus dajiuhuensis]|uniref:DNA adenine methylase n=1 Tax=Candidatus Magnetominusculus dajiuhuensis TaxID=3137712 RepID=UPI003B43C6AA